MSALYHEVVLSWRRILGGLATIVVLASALRSVPWGQALGLLLVYALSTGCFILVTRAFHRDDPPRRGWRWLAISGMLILVTVVVYEFCPALAPLGHLANISANLCYVAAFAAFARTFHTSELVPTWSNTEKIVLTGLAAAAAAGAGLDITGEYTNFASQAESKRDALHSIARSVQVLADGLVFLAAIVVVRSVLPMRHGNLARPYLLLGGGALTFFAMDIMGDFTVFDESSSLAVVPTMLEYLASGCEITAALVQLKLLRDESRRP